VIDDLAERDERDEIQNDAYCILHIKLKTSSICTIACEEIISVIL